MAPGRYSVLAAPTLLCLVVALASGSAAAAAECNGAREGDRDTHLVLAGRAQLGVGNVESAKECFRLATKANAKSAVAWSGYADAQLRLGETEGALLSCARATAVAPTFAHGWLRMADTLSVMKRIDESIECYKRALDLRPDLGDAHERLAGLLFSQGRHDEAAQHLDYGAAGAHGSAGSAPAAPAVTHTRTPPEPATPAVCKTVVPQGTPMDALQLIPQPDALEGKELTTEVLAWADVGALNEHSVDCLFVVDALDRIPHYNLTTTLQVWRGVLKPGKGWLAVVVNDARHMLQHHVEHVSNAPAAEWQGMIDALYGNADGSDGLRKNLFWGEKLGSDLAEAGFTDVTPAPSPGSWRRYVPDSGEPLVVVARAGGDARPVRAPKAAPGRKDGGKTKPNGLEGKDKDKPQGSAKPTPAKPAPAKPVSTWPKTPPTQPSTTTTTTRKASGASPAVDVLSPPEGTAGVAVLVYSRDSPAHLLATLDSVAAQVTGAEQVHVVYSASTAEVVAGYDVVRAQHPDVEFVQESEFDGDLKDVVRGASAASSATHFMLLTDRNVFTREVDANEIAVFLAAHGAHGTFQLGVGRDLDTHLVVQPHVRDVRYSGEDGQEQATSFVAYDFAKFARYYRGVPNPWSWICTLEGVVISRERLLHDWEDLHFADADDVPRVWSRVEYGKDYGFVTTHHAYQKSALVTLDYGIGGRTQTKKDLQRLQKEGKRIDVTQFLHRNGYRYTNKVAPAGSLRYKSL